MLSLVAVVLSGSSPRWNISG